MNQQAREYILSCIDRMIKNISSNYFGVILSRLPLVESNQVAEYAVSADGELLYNPDIESIKNKDVKRTIRDLLHEASHIALEHFSRKENLKVDKGNHKNFNIAADCTIEHMLDNEFPWLAGDPKHHAGLEQHISRDKWGNSSTESLYLSIKGTPQPDEEEGNHLPQLSEQGKQQLASALAQASKDAVEAIKSHAETSLGSNSLSQPEGNNGIGDIPDTVKNLLNLDNEDIPTNSLYLISKLFHKSFGRGESKDDSVFNQRNLLRREFMGEALMGRHQRTEAENDGEVEQWHNDVVIYADVSGSMSKESIRNSFKLILKLAKEYGVAPVTVHTYNIAPVQTFLIEENTDFRTLQFKTGGGTNINKVLNLIPPKNKLVFILTDMEDQPVTQWKHEGKLVWLIHENYRTNHENFKVGEKIYINDIVKGVK